MGFWKCHSVHTIWMRAKKYFQSEYYVNFENDILQKTIYESNLIFFCGNAKCYSYDLVFWYKNSRVCRESRDINSREGDTSLSRRCWIETRLFIFFKNSLGENPYSIFISQPIFYRQYSYFLYNEFVLSIKI